LYVDYLSVTYEPSVNMLVSIAPENGTEFVGSQQVTLTASDPSAVIYYTTNGATPEVGAEGTSTYEAPFTITKTCIVKAIAVKGDVTSSVASSEFIKKSIAETITSYVKVTSQADLVDGGVYLIVNEEYSKLLGWQYSNNRRTSAVTISNGVITDANCASNDAGDDDELARELVLGTSGSKYTFYDAIEGGYLYAASSSSNHLKTQTKLDDNGKASISFDANGNATITFQGSNERNLLRYNDGSSLFSCYVSGQKDIQLYRKVVQAKTAEAVGNFGTFYSESAYRMPQGLTGSVVYAVEGNSIKFTEVYKGGDEVPAYTALLISSGEVAGSFYASVLSKDVEAKHVQADNLLEGGRADDGKTAMSVRSDVLYYKLAVNGSDYGFYWGAEDGAPFTMKNLYTAYLAVPKSLGVKSFNINWNDVTGIEEVKNETRNGAKEGVYTLTGRRIFTDVKKLPKGLYIVNGNKVMVK
ncbi:MAG: chitobiase/beta-hexosaminidase C-terminal domain-containing protein, partial [Paraprevotella sp.]|nr:chitobiase/beta-hexosaminidase C-terminal domain-containing protein [Paraprevotella sp.]